MREKNVNYVIIAIISVVSIIILSIIVVLGLFYFKILNRTEITPLADALAGGAIGCIGTLIAVILTIYQTNRIYDRNKKNERMKLAYDKMPIFVVGGYQGQEALILFKENEQNRIKVQFAVKNISNEYVWIDGYSAIAYRNSESILSVKANEKIESCTVNTKLRNKTKVKIGYNEYEYRLKVIQPKEETGIVFMLDIEENISNFNGDIYIHVNLKYKNVVGQYFDQELLLICNCKLNVRKTFYKGEEMPTAIKC